MIEDNINNLKVDLNRIEEKIQSLKKNEKKSIHRRNFANFLTKNLLYHKVNIHNCKIISKNFHFRKFFSF